MCPSRPLVSEPFANQIEMIEKALIEAHNQPPSYFGRRARTPAHNSAGGTVGAGSFGYTSRNGKAPYKYGYQNMDYYNYRGGMELAENLTPYDNHIPQVFEEKMYDSGFDKAFDKTPEKGFDGFGNKFGKGFESFDPDFNAFGSHDAVNEKGNVYEETDEKAFGRGAAAFADGKKHEGLATFDPFSSEKEFSGTFFPSPAFNTSSNLLSSNYTSTSSNIWGSGGKTMAGDAAVWG